jgi:hypothetical protein
VTVPSLVKYSVDENRGQFISQPSKMSLTIGNLIPVLMDQVSQNSRMKYTHLTEVGSFDTVRPTQSRYRYSSFALNTWKRLEDMASNSNA